MRRLAYTSYRLRENRFVRQSGLLVSKPFELKMDARGLGRDAERDVAASDLSELVYVNRVACTLRGLGYRLPLGAWSQS